MLLPVQKVVWGGS